MDVIYYHLGSGVNSVLKAFDSDFSEKWSVNLTGMVDDSLQPVLGEDGTIFVSTDNYSGSGGTLYARNPEDGSYIWSSSTDCDGLIVFKNVLLGSSGDKCYVFNISDGSLVKTKNYAGGLFLYHNSILYAIDDYIRAFYINYEGPADSPCPMTGINSQHSGTR